MQLKTKQNWGQTLASVQGNYFKDLVDKGLELKIYF